MAEFPDRILAMSSRLVKLWLKCRGAWALLPAVGVFAGAGSLLGAGASAMPTAIGGGSSYVLWASVLPLLWTCLAAEASALVGAPPEARPISRLRHLDVALLCTAVLIPGALAASGVLPMQEPLRVLASTLILGGLAISIRIVFSVVAAITACCGLFLITQSYAPNLPGSTIVRVLQVDGNLAIALTLGSGLFALAVACLAFEPLRALTYSASAES